MGVMFSQLPDDERYRVKGLKSLADSIVYHAAPEKDKRTKVAEPNGMTDAEIASVASLMAEYRIASAAYKHEHGIIVTNK